MKALHSLFLAAALAPALLSVSAPAHAWGAQPPCRRSRRRPPHPAARAEVDRLLATEPDATLASIAPWADQLRARTRAWAVARPAGTTSTLPKTTATTKHRSTAGTATHRRSPQGAERHSGRPQPDDGERLQALKFVVHLVGDIHQPMHAGYAHDKGGNDFQLQFGNRGTNLHSLWDSGMLNTRKLDDAGYLPVLQSQRAPKLARQSNPQRDRRPGPRPAAASPCNLAFIRPRVKSVTSTPSATGRWPKRPLAEAQLPANLARAARAAPMPVQVQSFFHRDSNTFSYLVSDPASGEAALIDPVLDYDPDTDASSESPLRAALAIEQQGLLRWLLETHAHADHVGRAPAQAALSAGHAGHR